VTATHPEQHQYPAHFEPPHGSTWKTVFGPGLVRGAWMTIAGFRPIDSGRQFESRAMGPTMHAASRIGRRVYRRDVSCGGGPGPVGPAVRR